MSGGEWGYQQFRINDVAEEIKALLNAAAESEHIVDWAESGDTVRRREDGSGAERDLYDLWLRTFKALYGDESLLVLPAMTRST